MAYSIAKTEAVFFFDGGEIVKAMLYPEFEAVLDQVVGIPDFAEQETAAVYAWLDGRARITACVFFNIHFDARGFASREWNIPLRQLAEAAAPGPDMGAGPIRLACRNQCPVAWHQRHLWDPDLAPGASTLSALRAAARENRLGILFDDEPPPAARAVPASAAPAEENWAPGQRQRTARALRQLRLQLSLLRRRRQEDIEGVQRRVLSDMEQLQARCEQQQQQLQVEQQRHERLHTRMVEQAREFEFAREALTAQLTDQLRDSRGLEASQLEALHQQFAAELRARLEAESAALKEMLEMREVELFYREEQLGSLREEVASLRREKQAILADTAERFMQRLPGAGVSFVAFQPGAGHFNVPLAAMGRYLDDPLAYAAEVCGVSRAHYEAWLSHHDCPVCAAEDQGHPCGEPVPRVSSPAVFMIGRDDRCNRHTALGGRAGQGVSGRPAKRSRAAT